MTESSEYSLEHQVGGIHRNLHMENPGGHDSLSTQINDSLQA